MLVEHVEAALVARSDGRQDDASLTLEAFGAAVDKRFERVWVLVIDHVDERGVDPPPGLDRIETTDNDVELFVVLFILVLDLAMVGGDLYARHALLNEFGCDVRFGTTDIFFTEEELAVEVGNVDGVHIDDMDVVKAGEGEVGEDLAAETASADDEDAALGAQKVFDGCAGLEGVIGGGAWLVKDPVYMVVPAWPLQHVRSRMVVEPNRPGTRSTRDTLWVDSE